MPKLSKSKKVNFEHSDNDGGMLELEPTGGGKLLLSVKGEHDELWKCVDITREQLRSMVEIAEGWPE